MGRKMRTFVLVTALLILVVSVNGVYSQEQEGEFISFEEFLELTAMAEFEEYVERPGVAVVDRDAFEEMREYIFMMYEDVEFANSFRVGEAYADCITIESQPSVRLLDLEVNLDPPDISLGDEFDGWEEYGEVEYLESPLLMGLVDDFGNEIYCDEGTIPMARITLERLVRFETLQGFFSKGPGQFGQEFDPEEEIVPASDGFNHKYAIARQYVDNYGGNSWLNLWNPTGGFSLSQHWYAADNPHQTVEGGWVVNEPKFDTHDAVLFIYWTADGYNSTGCYNLDCTAFVQTNNHWYLGAPWTQYSNPGGTQWGFELQWKLYDGNWWLFLRGPGEYEPVGYYPTSIFDGGPLSRHAERISYGGETATKSDWPEMGSGEFANQGWQYAAFQSTIFYTERDENNGVGVWANLTESEGSPSCYTIDLFTGGSWGVYFYFGGPGGNSC